VEKHQQIYHMRFDLQRLEEKLSVLISYSMFFHISIIGGCKFCGNVGKSDAFADFSKYCGKLWENPHLFSGFFHDFPQYGISMKHSILYTL